MNANSTIKLLRAMSDALSHAANDPKYYNSSGSKELEDISYNLFCQSNAIENLNSFWGLPQLDEVSR